MFQDGRRTVVNFLLPGDLLGFSTCPGARVLASHIALTKVVLSSVIENSREGRGTLLYELGVATERQRSRYLANRIAGLGRRADERAAFVVLDWFKRLDQVGLVNDGSFELPVTQEVLAEALGSSVVHVNRILQHLRKSQIIEWKKGRLSVLNMTRLSELAGLQF